MTDPTTSPQLVLFQPDIPGNTGTVLRLAACLGVRLHIIEPAGFRIDDKSLLRAGMDYLDLAQLVRHDDWEQFKNWQRAQGGRLILHTTSAKLGYHRFAYRSSDFMLFGRETAGVTQEVADACDETVIIPMRDGTRSLNLAVSVAMATGEALRQVGHLDRL